MAGDIGDLLERARRSALAPEQELLRMVANRRLSMATLERTHEKYLLAAKLVGQVIETIRSRVKESGNDGRDERSRAGGVHQDL